MTARAPPDRASAPAPDRASAPAPNRASAPAPGRRPFHVALAAVGLGLALGGAEPGQVLAAGQVVAAGHVLAGAAAAGLLLALLRAPRLGALAAVLVLAAAGLAGLRLRAIDAPAAAIRGVERVEVRAHLLGAPRPGPFGASAEVRLVGGGRDGTRLLARAPRWAPFPERARPGMELVLRGRLEPVHAGDRKPGEGSFDFDSLLRRRGIAGELLADEVRLTGARRGGPAGLLDRMRARAERGVAAGMASAEAALLRGMVLGQDERIQEAVRDDFRASGLAHLLAVSGQNVMLLAALALPLLMVAGAGLRLRLAAMGALIALYVPLAGAGPSLQRAGVMGLAGLAALAASRPASRWYALLLAAAATLAWNPRAWQDPGWQLSFAAVVGILTLGVPLQRGLRRTLDELVPRRPPPAGLGLVALADGTAITVAATLATAPLLAHHFGAVSPAGLPANLLALPAVPAAMWLGMLKIALGQAAALGAPAQALATPAAAGLGALADVPVGLIAALAERFAGLPAGRFALVLPSPVSMLAAYAVVGAGALAVRRGLGRLGPHLLESASRWRALPASRRAACAALAASVLAFAAALTLGPPGTPDRLSVRFLDVGQGDATLIQHPDGTAVLFDGGSPEAGVARLLRRAGVRRLALVVATHASRDHHGGLVEVLRGFAVDTLLDGGDGSRDPGFRAVLSEAADRGVRRIPATAPLELGLAGGALRVRVLGPAARSPGPPPEDPNPRAVVAVVSAAEFDLLLSADAESETLLALELPAVEAMKVPHHGSSDEGLGRLLHELRPELAAIEVGPNTYGHPHPATLAALRRAGVTTYRTDRHGTITLSLHGRELRVDTER